MFIWCINKVTNDVASEEMERGRTNVAPASQQEVSISIPDGNAANSVQPLQNGNLRVQYKHY